MFELMFFLERTVTEHVYLLRTLNIKHFKYDMSKNIYFLSYHNIIRLFKILIYHNLDR